MTLEIALVLGIIGIAVFFFVSEKLPVDIVSVLVMILLVTVGILTPEEGFSGFSNSATLTVGAMFVISASIFKTGILNSAGTILTQIGRKNYTLCLLTIMIFSGIISAFINDTAVVALFMPIVIQVAKDSKISPTKLLMPLSFGALMGGVCTLIGTSTNILVSGIAARQGEAPFSMFEMAPAGLVFLIVGILYIVFVGGPLLPNRKANESIAENYGMGIYLTEILLLPKSVSVGKTIANSHLLKVIDIEIIEVIRNKTQRLPISADLVLEANDVLRVRCDVEKLKTLKDQEGIRIKSDWAFKQGNLSKTKLYEAIVTPNSDLKGKSLKALNFRALYGASVLAIRQRDEMLYEKLADVSLNSGDVLLISSNEVPIQALKDSGNILVISETATQKFNYSKTVPAMLIIGGVILSAAFNLAPIVLTAAIGALLLILTKCIKIEEAYRAIEWKVIFMLAGVLSMGAALEKTGAANLLSESMIASIGQWGPHAMVSAFFFITFMITNFMSNNATAALLAPIAIVAANSMDVSARPFLMAVTYAASFSFMTPIGYQTNTMIYGPGNYRFKDFLKVGTPLNILFWILASIIIPFFFPF